MGAGILDVVCFISGATGLIAAAIAMFSGYSSETQYIALLLGFTLGFLISTSVEAIEVEDEEINGQK